LSRTVDAQLIQDARAGNASAFDALIGPYIEHGYRLAMVMLGSPPDAEDAVQEGALRAWQKFGQFRGGHSEFRQWFLAIVANQCRSLRRGAWWSVLRLPAIERTGGGLEERIATESELVTAMRRLRVQERTALFLYFYLDLPIEQVSGIVGLSVNGTKSRIHRALRRMRQHLRAEDVR
jgi:RNA polymerase sigma-70 factor (ECF subfamily)